MRTHTSNYRIDGFVADVSPAELAALGRRIGLPTLEDLGSGALVDLRPFGLAYERTVPQAIADGIDLVAFSGDKLLGGPQAGILVGKHALVARMLANPLLRALRVDKATLAALGATLRLFLDPAAVRRVPFYAMLALGLDGLRRRAESVRAMLGTHAPRADVVETRAYAGGGTLPLSPLTSAGLRIDPPGRDASALAQRLRRARPPVVGRVEDGAFFLDLRAIAESQDALVARALVEAFEA
jgi:L-seryl-tRNA(Ser) seleniumtransferase